MNIRKIAYEILFKVFFEKAYSTLSLSAAQKAYSLDSRDTAFLSTLVYGVLEKAILLDFIIAQYASIPLKKIDKKTLVLLRLGVYQLLFLDRVPDSAAVNECVKLTKILHLFRSTGFVNAILRAIVRHQKQYDLPDPSDRLTYLSVKYSCPKEIVAVFCDGYGDEIAEKILHSFEKAPALYLRVNTLKITKEDLKAQLNDAGYEVEDVPFLPHSLKLSHSGSVEKLPGFDQGLFFVQDAASSLSCELFDAKAGETICDVCSAPGGKSFYAAMNMNNTGTIHAYDIYDHKIRLIEDGAKRLGIDIISASIRDAEDENTPLPQCDRVLCDVPCSGLGILRRKPEIRYNQVTNIDILPHLQYSILCNNTNAIPIGGVILYSTCTLNVKENREIVERFLNEHPDFSPEPLSLPKGFERMIDEPEHMLTILPYGYDTDGFFVAKMKRTAR